MVIPVNTRVITVIKAVAFALCLSQTRAEEPVSADNFVSNLKRMVRAAVTDAKVDKDAFTVFVLSIPGLGLDPKVDPNKPADAKALYFMLNRLPSGDLTGQTTADSMADIYGKVFTNSKIVGPPPDPSIVKRIADLTTELKSLKKDYYQYQSAYVTACIAYNKA